MSHAKSTNLGYECRFKASPSGRMLLRIRVDEMEQDCIHIDDTLEGEAKEYRVIGFELSSYSTSSPLFSTRTIDPPLLGGSEVVLALLEADLRALFGDDTHEATLWWRRPQAAFFGYAATDFANTPDGFWRVAACLRQRIVARVRGMVPSSLGVGGDPAGEAGVVQLTHGTSITRYRVHGPVVVPAHLFDAGVVKFGGVRAWLQWFREYPPGRGGAIFDPIQLDPNRVAAILGLIADAPIPSQKK